MLTFKIPPCSSIHCLNVATRRMHQFFPLTTPRTGLKVNFPTFSLSGRMDFPTGADRITRCTEDVHLDSSLGVKSHSPPVIHFAYPELSAYFGPIPPHNKYLYIFILCAVDGNGRTLQSRVCTDFRMQHPQMHSHLHLLQFDAGSAKMWRGGG